MHFIKQRLLRALQCRGFGRIPAAWLNDIYFTLTDDVGWTIIHHAAAKGWLDRIPRRLLDEFNLWYPSDGDGHSALYLAALYDQFEKVPAILLTRENLNWGGLRGQSVFHALAERNALHLVAEWINEENLLRPNIYGCTPLHAAARGGKIEQIPASLQSPRNMMMADNDGMTPLHWLALAGKLHTISYELLTPAAVLSKNANGVALLDLAFEWCELHYVPISAELAARFEEVQCIISLLVCVFKSDNNEHHSFEAQKQDARKWIARLARAALRT